jgi:hypothetical protein
MKCVRVFNSSGKLMETMKPDSRQAVIDLQKDNAGVYFVSIYTSKNIYVRTVSIGK